MNIDVICINVGNSTRLEISITVPKGISLNIQISSPLFQWAAFNTAENDVVTECFPHISSKLPYKRLPALENGPAKDSTPSTTKLPLSRVRPVDPEDWINFADLLKEVDAGLDLFPPELCEEGVNGTYFLKNKEGKKIAIFKPQDEEGNSANNPKKSEENSDLNNKRIPIGEGCKREVAAYLLDRDSFYSVPRTVLTEITHDGFQSGDESSVKTKTGSLQEYIEHDGASWDIGSNVFDVEQVHKIGVLDLHIFNNDRHGGNILYKKNEENKTYELIPIDHGFSLPEEGLDHAWFDWMYWPQAKKPFSDATLKHIEKIDIENDAKMLAEKLNINPVGIRSMKMSTLLLKRGAAKGLSLFEIASLICRKDVAVPSPLENMFLRAQEDLKSHLDGSESEADTERKLLEILPSLIDLEIESKLHPKM